MSDRRLYLDTETTAGYKNELVEISCIYTVNFVPVEVYTARIIHDEPVTAKGYEIHGIADFMCTTPVFDMLHHVYPFFRNADVICGHNISFDIGVLRSLNDKILNGMLSETETWCTMTNYREVYKTIYTGRSSSTKRIQQSYGSLSDCESYLINNYGYTDEKLKSEFNLLFKNLDNTHHSSPYDTFLCYLFDKVMHARKV